MKKLLIATDSFLPRPDGIAIFLKEVVSRLKRNYKITIIAPHFGDLSPYADFFEGVDMIRFPLSKIKISDFSLAKPKKKIIRKAIRESDIIFTQTIGPIGISAINIAKKMKKPIVAYVHNVEWELFKESIKKMKGLIEASTRFFARTIYNKCDTLLMSTQELADNFTKRKIRTEKIIVNLAVDSKRFSPAKDKREAKIKLGINPDLKVIGSVGRLAPEKDLQTLYGAFGLIKEKHKDTMLLVVGSGMKSEVIEGKNIKFVGKKDDPSPYYQAMDIYVLSSLTETTSLTTLEAMSCGCAVVCTPVGLVQHYVRTRKNGWLFPKGNVYRLNLILEKLLEDDDLREYLGGNARKTVLDGFNWSETVFKLEEVFNKFIILTS